TDPERILELRRSQEMRVGNHGVLLASLGRARCGFGRCLDLMIHWRRWHKAIVLPHVVLQLRPRAVLDVVEAIEIDNLAAAEDDGAFPADLHHCLSIAIPGGGWRAKPSAAAPRELADACGVRKP